MAKEKKERDSRPVHFNTKVNHETHVWKTACGLKLSKQERAETVLTTEWEHVTCKKCKEKKP